MPSIEINPDALADRARSSTGAARESGAGGPLHGLPVLLKANIDTADRLATSAGSLALAHHHAAADAPVVAQLCAGRRGDSRQDELERMGEFSLDAIDERLEQPRRANAQPVRARSQPVRLVERSAVAVAARLAPLARRHRDGRLDRVPGRGERRGRHQADARSREPAAASCRSRASQDTAGPFARNVADAASATARDRGARRAAALRMVARAFGRERDPSARGTGSLAGLRLGVVRDYAGAGGDRRASTRRSALRSRSCEPRVPSSSTPSTTGAERSRRGRGAHGAARTSFAPDRRLSARACDDGPRSLDELIAFDTAHAGRRMPHFRARPVPGRAKDDGARCTGLSRRARDARAFSRAARDDLCDRTARRARGAGQQSGVAHRPRGRRPDRRRQLEIAAVSGYPSIAVPAELVGELPVGLAFDREPWTERAVGRDRGAFEAGRGAFPAPRYLATVAD